MNGPGLGLETKPHPTLFGPWIIGKRVTSVKTNQLKPRTGEDQTTTELTCIEFEDGSKLWVTALESDDEPYVYPQYQKPPENPVA